MQVLDLRCKFQKVVFSHADLVLHVRPFTSRGRLNSQNEALLIPKEMNVQSSNSYETKTRMVQLR